MPLKELRKYLDSLSPISAITWDKMEVLFKEKTLNKNDHFVKEGQVAREIGFLYNGVMRGYFKNNQGVEYNKHFFISPGFIGGYASLVTEKPNQINQQALTDCSILVANFADIKTLYPFCPDLERAARILAEQFFVQKEQREIEIVLLDADKRYRIFQKEFPQLEQLIPQYQVASYLGITPTQLSRIRRKISGR